MKTSITRITTGLIAAALATTVWGFEVDRTRTNAEIVPPSPIEPVIQLNFRAWLFNASFVGLDDIVITWEQAGGVTPEPFRTFRVLIPAGCFVRNRGFHVEDFEDCGVQMTFGDGLLLIREFASRLVQRTDGSARLTVRASFMSRDQAHAILGALGGAVVEIDINSEPRKSPPLRIKTVTGAEPETL